MLCLFLGPLLVSVSFQWYIFLGTRTLARTQGILTQLVFEHSLRIRFKAEGSGDRPATSAAVTPAETPETRSIAEGAGEEADAQSVRTESTAASKGKAKAGPEPPAAEPKKKDNLVGKINTLVTVDLDNIIGGKDFLMCGKYQRRKFFNIRSSAKLPPIVLQVPVELGVSIVFLYIVLGWRSVRLLLWKSAQVLQLLISAPWWDLRVSWFCYPLRDTLQLRCRAFKLRKWRRYEATSALV